MIHFSIVACVLLTHSSNRLVIAQCHHKICFYAVFFAVLIVIIIYTFVTFPSSSKVVTSEAVKV